MRSSGNPWGRAQNLFGCLLISCAAFLTSCATTSETPQGNAAFRFSVLRYKEPVEVPLWRIDIAQSANPEGAALNILTAMQQGNVKQWLAYWDISECPKLNDAQREELVQKWQSLKNRRILVLGRVIANADLIIELAVAGEKEEKIQFPLRHTDGQWWLMNMDPTSEFLHWENSPNKIVESMDTMNLRYYLKSVKAKG